MNILAVAATGSGGAEAMATTTEEGDAVRAARAAKRASLVKRKPVPPLYPADEQVGSTQTQTPPPVPPVPVLETAKTAVIGTTTSDSGMKKAAQSTEGSATPAPAPANEPKEVPLTLPPLQIPGFRSSMTPPAVPPRRRPVPIVEVSLQQQQAQKLGTDTDMPRPSLSLSTRSSSESSHQSSNSTACESGGESETSEGSAETESAGPRTPTPTRALSVTSMMIPIEVSTMKASERDSVQALIATVVRVADVDTDSDGDAGVGLGSEIRDSVKKGHQQKPSLDAGESVYETADDGESQLVQTSEEVKNAGLDALSADTDADAEEEADARTITDLPKVMKRARAKTLPARRKRLSEGLA